MKNFDSEIVHTSKLNPFHIWKMILKFFAALFIKLWNFRVFLLLTFFAKLNNKVTRRDYVNWGTIVEINRNTEYTLSDSTFKIQKLDNNIKKVQNVSNGHQNHALCINPYKSPISDDHIRRKNDVEEQHTNVVFTRNLRYF